MHTSNSFIRVIDQLLPVLAMIRQSSDLDEAEAAIKLERELAARKSQAQTSDMQEAA